MGVRRKKPPRPFAWVKPDLDSMVGEQRKAYEFYVRQKERLIYLGQIPNQPGHCFVQNFPSGDLIVMHTDDVIELSEEEV